MDPLKPDDAFCRRLYADRTPPLGRFAEVWKAEQRLSTITMVVALKIFPAMDPKGVAEVEAEYQTQSSLQHSNLLIARRYGLHQNRPYLEMRYCKNGDGSDYLGKFNEDAIAKCLYQVSSALNYLHKKEILHQDIKPNNFLINAIDNTTEDDTPRERDCFLPSVNDDYYLADLGLSVKLRKTIVRLTEAKNDSDPSSGKIAGKGTCPPPYRAPELSDKNKGPVKASDIWALGSSVFEMITEEMPFGEWGGVTQLRGHHIADLPKGYSPELNKIIKMCLAKDAWDRPNAEKLSTWANNYLTKGYYISPKTVKPNKYALVVAASLLLVILIFGAYKLFHGGIGDKSRDTLAVVQQSQNETPNLNQPPHYDPPHSEDHKGKNGVAPTILNTSKKLANGHLKGIVVIENDHFSLFVIEVDNTGNYELDYANIKNSSQFSADQVGNYIAGIESRYNLTKDRIKFYVRDETALRNPNASRIKIAAFTQTASPVVLLYDPDQARDIDLPKGFINQYLK